MRYSPKSYRYVRLKSKFHHKYLWSIAPRAYRVHYIDHLHSYILFDKATRNYKVIVRLLCEGSIAVANQMAGNEIPSNKKLCTMCHTVKETGRSNPFVRNKW